jgi:DNA-binding transcriptional MerR regulator
LALPAKRLTVLNPVHSFRHACAMSMLAKGESLSDIRNQLGHEDIQSTAVYLQLDLPRRRQIQQNCTHYTKSILVRNAEIEELIDNKDKDDIMKWLDSL